MTKTYADSAVAVIGMACRLPGANNLDQFWELVRAGRAAWGPIPDERLNRKLYYDPRRGVLNRTYSDLAALVSYQPVDRQLCPLSEKAIASYDPAHVTLCEVAAAACRHAGFDPAAVPHPNTGVYVGHAAASGLAAELTYATYISRTAGFLREAVGFEQLGQGLGEEVIREIVAEVRRDCPRRSPDGAPYFGASLAAGLISRTFALDGPYMSFNAACASSSRALVQAMRALQLGNVDMAMVGGASYFHSDTLVLFAQSHSLSPTGSHPFSAGADGMIVGEGYAVLVLKMLSRAIADGNRVLAVIPSVGLSSDGRGKSLWAPRQEGQIEAIGRAYGDEVAIDRLEYIEAHATSTSLGDVTEVASLTKVLDGRLPPGKRIAAGSAKLNVGHTLEVAGLVGVLKTILALNHDVIPPAIDDRPLNPQIDWENAPIYVPRAEVPWPRHADETPRRAGVNAFGIGGLNVHVVVDDFVGSRPATSRAASLPPRTSVATEKDSKAEGNGREGSKPAAATEVNEDGAVAIIGRGAVMPGALTLEAFWELFTSGRDPKTGSPEGRWNPKDFPQPATEPVETCGGYVTGFEYDWRKHKIPPKEIAQASPLQFMMLDAVDQAIHRSGYRERPFDRRRVGVVVGTTFGGACAAELAVCLRLPEFQETLARLLRAKGIAENLIEGVARSYGEVLMKHMPILLDETGSFTASALASRITKTFDLMGSAVAVDAAGGSSMAALSCCVEILRAGDCDMMVCVGGEQDLTPVHFEEWSIRGRLPAAAPRSPMDARADGIVPGEGCGAILLKRLSDARRDGDPIFGIVRGVGAAYDPCQNRAVRLAIGRALTDAGASADEVGLVETTATGLVRDDAAQWQGLAEALNHPARSRPAVLSIAAGQLGDSGAGAGMAALLKATMEIDSLTVPRDPGIEQPSPQLVRHADVLTVPLASTTLAPNRYQTVLAGIHSGSPEEVTYHAYIERSTKVTTKVQTMKPALETAESSATLGRAAASSIPHFDATERRRAKMRDRARAVPVSPATAQPPVPEYHAPPATAATATPTPVPTPLPAPPTEAAAEATNLDAKELESFLVNFVVEHTGYPPEIVELDADLEADLGIDSIKKAQLFGELGEYFDVQPSENLSLDDFSTLRHVLAFLVTAQGTVSGAASSESSGQSVTTGTPVAPSAPVMPTDSIPAAPPTTKTETATEATNLDAKELENFLVNFVVEHTGYPPEIVELDADLEADLGIDSIKKAQLFGELGEYFDVQPSENLSLDDFSTLRHVLAFLVKAQGTVSGAASSESSGQSVTTTTPVAPSAPVVPTDSIPAAPPTTKTETATEATNLDAKELENFLVNFVVEHTGYPPEIVELDADLEADLGIDSIKKAQLFGELGEYFDVQPSENLSLDDFSTLRHVLAFLVKSQGEVSSRSHSK